MHIQLKKDKIMNTFTQYDFLKLTERLKKATGDYSSIKIEFNCYSHSVKPEISYSFYIADCQHVYCNSIKDLIENVEKRINSYQEKKL